MFILVHYSLMKPNSKPRKPSFAQLVSLNVLLYSICIKTLKSVCQPCFQCFRLTNIFVK